MIEKAYKAICATFRVVSYSVRSGELVEALKMKALPRVASRKDKTSDIYVAMCLFRIVKCGETRDAMIVDINFEKHHVSRVQAQW